MDGVCGWGFAEGAADGEDDGVEDGAEGVAEDGAEDAYGGADEVDACDATDAVFELVEAL